MSDFAVTARINSTPQPTAAGMRDRAVARLRARLATAGQGRGTDNFPETPRGVEKTEQRP
jgi:hypothetical protein